MSTMPFDEMERPPLWIQFWDLLIMELTNWRWSWRSSLIIATVAPLLSILALAVFARDSGPEAMMYVLTGNVVISLMFGNMDKMQSHFVFMRFRGTLDYYASLPVRRGILIAAIVTAFVLLSIPSVVVTLLFGARITQVPLHLHPLILAVVPLCAIPLAGIGAMIGMTMGRENAGSASLLVTMVLAGLGPVIVPPGRLPAISLWLGKFSPATYAASALRQTMVGPLTGQLWWDLSVLLALSVVILWLVGQKIDWRQR